MPSPLGHILGGAAVYLAGTKREFRSRVMLVMILVGSVAPDFDFLPGIFIGDVRAFHRGVSHSLALAVAFGVLAFFFSWKHQKDLALRIGMLAALAYASHIFLDLISVNEGARGVPILWPASSHQFGFNLDLLGFFHYGPISHGIWSVIRWDNVSAFSRELIVLGCVVMICLWRERRSSQTSDARNSRSRNN
jgi:membrane-bound metal-dependent hydrolase YbcI (DUF457 family)